MVSMLLTGLSYRYALSKALIDIPNERSSHTTPTAKGGGIAIVVTFFAALVGLQQWDMLASNVMWALVGGGGLVALVGWMDDHRDIAAIWRILVHLLAALWALFWLGQGGIAYSDNAGVSLGWIGITLSAIGIVWFTNLYNFMDGADGLAGMQAVSAGLAGGGLLWLAGAQGLALASLALASASAGFLMWNWPPARIFMGDVGSGFLGFSFAVLALTSQTSGALPVLLWVVLLAIFVMDASFTLLRRMLHREPWYRAHRTHAYQRLVQAGFTHRQVVLAALGLNVLVLWPMAWLVWAYPGALPGVLLATVVGSWVLWVFIQHKFRPAVNPCR